MKSSRAAARVWVRAATALAGIGVVALAPELSGAASPPAKAGFPLTITGGGVLHAGHPAVADLGLRAGKKSIVFGTSAHKLFVVNENAQVATGFPVTLPADIVSSPAVGDLDGDGAPEIVVGYGSTFEPSSPGGVRAYRRNGQLLWERVSLDFGTDGIPDAVNGSPTIADFDGDGVNDVAWTSFDARVYLVKGADGTDKPGWPIFVRDTIFTTPAAHDIDGDGKPDLIVGVDSHLEGPPYNTIDGGCIHVFNYKGIEPAGFPRCVDQVIWSSPVVGDIDGDGKPEIVSGTGSFFPSRVPRLHAWHCDGSIVDGFPINTEGVVSTTPALADLTGDGVVDVIYTANNSGTSARFTVNAVMGDGTSIFRAEPRSLFGNNQSADDPIVADVTGDGEPEVLVPTATEIAVFSKAGVQLTDNGTGFAGSFSYFTDTTIHHAVVANMENDGSAVEVIAVSGSPFPTPTDAKVFVWNPKVALDPAWGMFHHDETRSGVVPGTGSCPNASGPFEFYTIPPCRVFDTRNPAGPLGGPSIAARTSRTFPVAGSCQVPIDAKAISGNLTVVAPSAAGNLRIYPGSGPAPLTSILNYKANVVRANNAIIRLGAGEVSVQNDQGTGKTHVLLDVNGYYR